MLYSLLKPILFAVDAELAHEITLEMLNQFRVLVPQTRIEKPVKVMGLEFTNPVGLAAGLDKNADYLAGLSKLGFGFIEVGTVTPKPQDGNPKPRLFRLIRHQSIINRMGFNNKGVDYLLRQIPPQPRPYVLGINIGKNLSTAVDNALSDYRSCFEAVYTQADYISINVSSPNTPGLRQLQNEDALRSLLKGLDETRKAMEDLHQLHRPVALKISPDLDDRTIPEIADILQNQRIDALIATNTTLDRSKVKGHLLETQVGGLSGKAVKDRSRHVLQAFYRQLNEDIPIISVGGISTPEEAQLRLDMGASLVQVYSGLIYHGPSLVADIARSLKVN
ncbi:MAG: quinone-dependent dihydroorotate dehydrogenase [Gammaproteobacteria bacterium]|nr:quinone-dependent dihydroorotate dehydrogenase [Gammaproteobacteria bacterium]